MHRRFGKVQVIACSGHDNPVGLVAREAALLAVEDLRPEASEVICLALLAVGDAGAVERVRSLPTIVVDGCRRGCASTIVRFAGAEPTTVICVADCADRLGEAARSSLKSSGENGLASLVSERVAEAVDEIREALRW